MNKDLLFTCSLCHLKVRQQNLKYHTAAHKRHSTKSKTPAMDATVVDQPLPATTRADESATTTSTVEQMITSMYRLLKRGMSAVGAMDIAAAFAPELDETTRLVALTAAATIIRLAKDEPVTIGQPLDLNFNEPKSDLDEGDSFSSPVPVASPPQSNLAAGDVLEKRWSSTVTVAETAIPKDHQGVAARDRCTEPRRERSARPGPRIRKQIQERSRLRSDVVRRQRCLTGRSRSRPRSRSPSHPSRGSDRGSTDRSQSRSRVPPEIRDQFDSYMRELMRGYRRR